MLIGVAKSAQQPLFDFTPSKSSLLQKIWTRLVFNRSLSWFNSFGWFLKHFRPIQLMIVRPFNRLYRTWLRNLAKLTQGGGLIPSLKILAGTLYVLTRELDDNILTHRERTMTFTCFVFFDMMNAMACRSQRKSITQLAHNYTLYVAIGSSSPFIGDLYFQVYHWSAKFSSFIGRHFRAFSKLSRFISAIWCS